MITEDERVRISRMWYETAEDDALTLAVIQDYVDRNENDRFDDDDEPISGGWDCD